MFRFILRLVFNRIAMFFLSFAVAVGGPLLALDPALRAKITDPVKRISGYWSSSSSAPDYDWRTAWQDEPTTASAQSSNDSASARSQPAAAMPSRPTLTGSIVVAVPELFDWSIAPNQVMARWTQISTAYDDPALDGMRVPVITGTGPDDLAGSLTYYFDQQYQLQRIAFDGTVGDPSKAVTYLTQRFGLQRQHVPGREIYVAKWNGYPTSVLRIQRSAVVNAAMPHRSMNVMLELNRPGLRYGLSRHMRSTLAQDGIIRR